MGVRYSNYKPKSLPLEDNVVVVNSVLDFWVPVWNIITLQSDKVYVLWWVVDCTWYSFEITWSGCYIRWYNFDLCWMINTEDNYTMFISESSWSWNILFTDIYIQTSGSNSKVFDLTDSDWTHAIEMNRVNFIACSSLGEITDYRQWLESWTGRFWWSPTLTFSWSRNGYRATTTISRWMSLTDPLFKTWTWLSFSWRFITDMNVDLWATAAFFDFFPSNFATDESLIIKWVSVFRNGVVDSSDTTIYPNIDETSVKSIWRDNVGVPNTQKYINSTISTEVTTNIASSLVYYPLEWIFTVNTVSHFNMPSNWEFELLSWNGKYFFSWNFEIEWNRNDVISIRVTKSTDWWVTYPTEINHIIRQINNLSWWRDVAFVPLSFIWDLNAWDRVRLEIENYTSSNNLTAWLDSFFIISEV